MDQDSKWIAAQINKRLSGQMPDADWEQFQRLVEEASKAISQCGDCFDRGYLSRNCTLYRCHCAAGRAVNDTFFAPSDKDKQKPLELKTWPKEKPNPDWERQKGEWD